MPRFDKTGPEGKGSKSGRGLGNCEPSGSSDKQGKETLLGRRRGSGRRGRGFGFWRRGSGTSEE
ncbi:MAG: DUF5320 domain-containing protein [Marinilabiliaceae bacterium]|nr:DUF5320 domain-containing protein [Marinilabiliaceae bacterium]